LSDIYSLEQTIVSTIVKYYMECKVKYNGMADDTNTIRRQSNTKHNIT